MSDAKKPKYTSFLQLLRSSKHKPIKEGDQVRNSPFMINLIIPSSALWSGTNMNRDVSTGPLARPFARSLASLTSLTP